MLFHSFLKISTLTIELNLKNEYIKIKSIHKTLHSGTTSHITCKKDCVREERWIYNRKKGNKKWMRNKCGILVIEINETGKSLRIIYYNSRLQSFKIICFTGTIELCSV